MNQIEYFLLLFGSLFVPDKNYILHLFAKEVVEKEFLSLLLFHLSVFYLKFFKHHNGARFYFFKRWCSNRFVLYLWKSPMDSFGGTRRFLRQKMGFLGMSTINEELVFLVLQFLKERGYNETPHTFALSLSLSLSQTHAHNCVHTPIKSSVNCLLFNV